MGTNVPFNWPGVKVTESTFGSVPISQIGFQTGKMVGTALRGPVNAPTLITRMSQYTSIFGPFSDSSYLDDAVRAWLDNAGQAPLYVVRVAGSGATPAAATLTKAGSSAAYSLTIVNATSFTLTVKIGASGTPQTTSSLTVSGLNAAAIQTALAALSNVGVGSVAVTGSGPYTITFQGSLAHTVLTLTKADTGGTTTLTNPTPGVADDQVLQITTIGPGSDYNYVASPAHGLSVTLVAGVLTVYDAGVAVERYRNVTASNFALAAQQINGQSNLINITWLDNTTNPDDTSSAAGLTGATDGGAISSATYIGTNTVSPPTGLFAFDQPGNNLGFGNPGPLMAPGITDAQTGAAMIHVAEDTRSIAFIDSTFGLSESNAILERDQYAATQGHGYYCYGWVQAPDPVSGALKWVPRSPYRAAHLVRSHSLPGGLANVGAGVDFQLRNVAALEVNVDDVTQGELNDAGVDVARNFSPQGYGLVHWAARTISPDVLYWFVQVRVIFSVLAASIEAGLKPYVFRPIDGKGRLAGEIKGSLDQLLWDLWNQGSLFGATAAEAFQVVLSNQSAAQLEEGILVIDVYAKPTPVAERIAVNLFRVPLAFDFNTGSVDIGDVSIVGPAQG